MITVTKASRDNASSVISALRARSAEKNAEISAAAADIMNNVRKNGWQAVVEYSLRFDRAEPFELTRTELEAAAASCPAELLSAIRRAAENIRDYQSRLLPKSAEWQVPGGILGQTVRGLHRVGVYVPGGAAAYPSTVLMNVIPAKVAGVGEVIVVTPPTKNLNIAVMAAAYVAGADRLIALGGAQAVAALTYGAGFVPRVDKLVGPGNAYVAAAKRLAFGEVDIDMVAGPSEVLIIADDTADPVYIAADMLSQAEHDALAASVLVTTSKALSDKVIEQLKAQSEPLERREIIRQSLAEQGAIIICGTPEDAARIADEAAPEHCEIMTENPRALLPMITNAGAIFLGPHSPEPLGDYMAGPSHVLPTSGTARFFSPLSAESFIKKTSIIEYTREGILAVADDIIRLARAEGLTAHAASVAARMNTDTAREK